MPYVLGTIQMIETNDRVDVFRQMIKARRNVLQELY